MLIACVNRFVPIQLESSPIACLLPYAAHSKSATLCVNTNTDDSISVLLFIWTFYLPINKLLRNGFLLWALYRSLHAHASSDTKFSTRSNFRFIWQKYVISFYRYWWRRKIRIFSVGSRHRKSGARHKLNRMLPMLDFAKWSYFENGNSKKWLWPGSCSPL